LQNKQFEKRKESVYSWLQTEKLDAVLIEDSEKCRSSSLRYLCGMPSDALLLLTASGKSILVPWDINLAEQLGQADEMVSYSTFERRIETAISELARAELPGKPKIELSSATPVPVFDKIRKKIEGEIFCRDGGVDALLDDLRAIKDDEELAVFREAAKITDIILNEVMDAVSTGKVSTELDIVFLLEMKARQIGAEGTGFPTLAAGPERSYAIHTYPNYTNGPWGTDGLSILDFGISLEGYTTDVTLTVAKGTLTDRQEEMIGLVEEAHNKLTAEIEPGMSTFDLAKKGEHHFQDKGYTMPHALGHGIGLAAHEAPIIRTREEGAVSFQPGMVFAIEPGLYDVETGGVRLENDFLITPAGTEQLTDCRIYRLP